MFRRDRIEQMRGSLENIIESNQGREKSETLGKMMRRKIMPLFFGGLMIGSMVLGSLYFGSKSLGHGRAQENKEVAAEVNEVPTKAVQAAGSEKGHDFCGDVKFRAAAYALDGKGNDDYNLLRSAITKGISDKFPMKPSEYKMNYAELSFEKNIVTTNVDYEGSKIDLTLEFPAEQMREFSVEMGGIRTQALMIDSETMGFAYQAIAKYVRQGTVGNIYRIGKVLSKSNKKAVIDNLENLLKHSQISYLTPSLASGNPSGYAIIAFGDQYDMEIDGVTLEKMRTELGFNSCGL